MTQVIMPKMGDGMEEGTLVEWLKQEGEAVKMGEPIATIQTDKATLEMESPGTGKLAGFLIGSGDTVPVGQPIAAILKEGEDLPGDWKGGGNGKAAQSAPKEAPKEEPAADEGKVERAEPQHAAVSAEEPRAISESGRVKASPVARSLAKEHGVDLAVVEGSGPGGRIIKKDVMAAAESGARPAARTQEAAPAAKDQEVKLNRLRQITAQRTTQSKQEVPHFYVTVEVDVERILGLRQQFEAEESGKVSINDFVVKACVLALQDMPVVNSTFQGDKLLQHGAIHVGIAAAVEEGLTVPVLKNAQDLSLRQISSRVKDLVGRARDNKLSMDELQGSTFSISNMGMLDVDNFVAIINAPNAAILAISSARKRVVVNEDDELEVRTIMNITGSFDHRVVDGAVGAEFMNVVKGYLQNPTRLLS
jgi:pyruvate dehydrogenase E2 component (dihydrolipoamide acetyltransferase)